MLAIRRHHAVVSLLLLTAAACGDDSSSDDDTSTDSAVPDAARLDAALPDGAAGDAAIDAPGGLPTTCTGACARTMLMATFDGTTRVLGAAYYGLTQTSGGSTIRVEAYRGSDPGCPDEGSGTPDQTLILVAIPVPTTTDPTTTTATLLDFEGALLGGPINASATAVTLVPTAASICLDCVGMPPPSDPDGVLALDADLTFADGTIRGHLFAKHCDSLDAVE